MGKKKTTISSLAKLLKNNDTKGDTSFWGVVQSVITKDGKVTGYNVSLDTAGTTGTIKCNKVVGAKEGDQVLVTLRANGEAVVTATKGGDTDAADAAEAANNSIASDTLHYLATSASSGVTRDTQGWTTTVQSMTKDKPYLWTYHEYTTQGGTKTYSDPVITGRYGQDGSSGSSSYTVMMWAASASSSSAPNNSEFTIAIPSLTSQKPYLWQCAVTVNGSSYSYGTKQRCQTMDGVYVFMNTVSNSGHTMIDGGHIDTDTLTLGKIANAYGDCAEVDRDGLHIWKWVDISKYTSQLKEVASFGDKVRLGRSDDYHTDVINGGFKVLSAESSSTTPGENTMFELGEVGAGDTSTVYLIVYDGSDLALVAESTITLQADTITLDGSVTSTGAVSGTSITGSGTVKGRKLVASSPTTSSSNTANCRLIASTGESVVKGEICYTNSSKYLKHDIKDIEDFDAHALYDLPVRQFVWNDDEDEKPTVGLIADEVDEIFPVAAMHRPDYRDGKDPSDWDERIILPAMLKLIQEQKEQIDALTERVEALENK